MNDREATEARCLEEARQAIAETQAKLARLSTTVDWIRLEGTYPDTLIVAEGSKSWTDRRWRATLPIWDPGAGGTYDGQPRPRFIGTLMLAAVLEA